MIFLMIADLGTRIIRSQNGCGRNVATEKAEWIGSGDVRISDTADNRENE